MNLPNDSLGQMKSLRADVGYLRSVIVQQPKQSLQYGAISKEDVQTEVAVADSS